MTFKDDYPVQSLDLSTGLKTLKQRQFKLQSLSVLSCVIFIAAVLSIFVQQDLVYHFLGLSNQINQLHIPLAVDQNLQSYIDHPNYLMNLLSWFGWLLLKIVISFIGAFFIVGFLKRFHFFLIRFQSFILKFVAWLLSFILLWSATTYVQYESNDDEKSAYQEFIYYDQNIQQSEIFKYLNDSRSPTAVKAYLLAQTALMHTPKDADAANAYVAQLVQAERKDPHFFEYGFKTEQLWVMQHAVLGKSVTASTQKLQPQVQKAIFWSDLIHKVLMGITTVFCILTILLYLLSNKFKQRMNRIRQQIHLQ